MAAGLGSPYDVTGAARLPDGRTALRLEGFATSVAYRTGALAAQLAPFGEAVVLAADDSAVFWRELRDVAPFHGRVGDVWRLSVKPSDAPALVAASGGEAVLDWGAGLVWLLVAPGADLRVALGTFKGHATLIRATPETRARLRPFHPEAPPLAALSRGLRARFDPRGILNPGLME
jgi:glycolate oxidase FAD binding subunit